MVSSKRMTDSLIMSCVVCRKLREHPGWQDMADPVEDRCKPYPPFSYDQGDTFVSLPVVHRQTR